MAVSDESLPVELDWYSLPSHVSELVLAHLSQKELSSLRSVCRSWLAAITSPHFHRLHEGIHRRAHPSLLLYNHAVKISACTWEAANDAGSVAIHRVPTWQDLSLPAAFVREWTGCHGLLCIRNHLTSNSFSVGCPFTNQWKALPDPPGGPLLCKLWAMVLHPFSSSQPSIALMPSSSPPASAYSIILLQLNTPSMYFDVYNSETNQWTRRCLPMQSDVVKGGGNRHVVQFSSMATCISNLVYTIDRESRSVITYNAQRNTWKCWDAKLPGNLVFEASVSQGVTGLVQVRPHLIERCEGKILLVAAASDGDDNITLAVIWEFDWARKTWREITRAPLHMTLHMVEEAVDVRKGAPLIIKYTGNAELVCVMVPGAQHALHFDVIQGKWAWLELPDAVNCDLSLCIQPRKLLETSIE